MSGSPGSSVFSAPAVFSFFSAWISWPFAAAAIASSFSLAAACLASSAALASAAAFFFASASAAATAASFFVSSAVTRFITDFSGVRIIPPDVILPRWNNSILPAPRTPFWRSGERR